MMPPELQRPYQGYVYSYPHKTAYRPIAPRDLSEVWAQEPKAGRFLYVHVPFCEMRCGFCNLFTLANPDGDLEAAYLQAVEREAASVALATDTARPAQVAFGGGTPTYLSARELAGLFERLDRHFQIAGVPSAIETSPKTATPDRLSVLREWGVQRVSIGVQSFVEADTRGMGRPQKVADVERALDVLRQSGVPNLNIDLIYGAAGQTRETWLHSINRALTWEPEEIYIYPLYVRPRTGLDGRHDVWDTHRLNLYRAGRDHLRAAGYTQVSMRHFRREGTVVPFTEHSCQEDGMVGLGPGARSYTKRFHYAMPFAVSRAGVLSTLQAYINKGGEDFYVATHGIDLSPEDQARRYLLKSILRSEGVDRARFAELFGRDPVGQFPELRTLVDAGLIEADGARLYPSAAGLERSDAIGPWLYARDVAQRMEAFETV